MPLYGCTRHRISLVKDCDTNKESETDNEDKEEETEESNKDEDEEEEAEESNEDKPNPIMTSVKKDFV